MIELDVLRPPQLGDAEPLFPLVYASAVTRTIVWDGPANEREYRDNWTRTVADTQAGRRHFFTIVDPVSSKAIGTCDVRPDDGRFRASLGLWIGLPFHGRGIGTRVIGDLVRYGFEVLGLCKLDAMVFCGNLASRRALEKNGFALEGTIRCALLKRGAAVDEWHLGLVNSAHPLLKK